MATSGMQGLTACREQRPDLMLVDIVMDGMDGYVNCVARSKRTRVGRHPSDFRDSTQRPG